MNPNPFRRVDPAGCAFVTDPAERLAMVRTFTREECLAANALNGLPQALVLALESRLRRLAGTRGQPACWARVLSDTPQAVASRRQCARRATAA